MNNIRFNYPARIKKKHHYLIRFQKDENDNNVDCWMNGFPMGNKDFSEATLPFEKAGRYWYNSAVRIRKLLNPDCFNGSGILSLVSYPEAVKIDSELRKLAANEN